MLLISNLLGELKKGNMQVFPFFIVSGRAPLPQPLLLYSFYHLSFLTAAAKGRRISGSASLRYFG